MYLKAKKGAAMWKNIYTYNRIKLNENSAKCKSLKTLINATENKIQLNLNVKRPKADYAQAALLRSQQVEVLRAMNTRANCIESAKNMNIDMLDEFQRLRVGNSRV